MTNSYFFKHNRNMVTANTVMAFWYADIPCPTDSRWMCYISSIRCRTKLTKGDVMFYRPTIPGISPLINLGLYRNFCIFGQDIRVLILSSNW